MRLPRDRRNQNIDCLSLAEFHWRCAPSEFVRSQGPAKCMSHPASDWYNTCHDEHVSYAHGNIFSLYLIERSILINPRATCASPTINFSLDI